jgi:cytochrome c peroxidase
MVSRSWRRRFESKICEGNFVGRNRFAREIRRAMKLKLWTVLLVIVGLAASGLGAAENPFQTQAKTFFGPLPDKMPGADKDTPALIRLGEKLFNEKALSANGSQSCNSCHRIDGGKGGVDNERTSLGAFGQRGGRNSPTVLNAGMQFAQFWDGRAPTLEHQAKGPILNPVEMAVPSDADAVKRLREIKEYPELFKGAFLTESEPLTYDNVAKAIAAFERTLITRDRFDDFQKGETRVLNAREIAGLKTFIETGCITCHSGPLLGGNAYYKVGVIHPYSTTDAGRAGVTKDPEDQQKFKVPTLRNVALTGPYFHDGKIISLEDAVRKMAWLQLDKRLTDEEVKSIVAFLNTLTDKARASTARSSASRHGG